MKPCEACGDELPCPTVRSARQVDAMISNSVRSLWLGLSLAVVSTATCAQAQEPSLTSARARLAARDFPGCLRELDALLQQRSGDRDALLTRGLCSAGRGDYASAVNDYTRA